jgi:hypothetical protein
VPETLPLARRLASTDREVYDRSQRAFVSYVRAYNEHKLSFIFRFERVPLAELGRLFGVLRIPAMTEIKSAPADFEPSQVDPDSVPYLDPVRERQRQERLVRKAEKRAHRPADYDEAAAAAAATETGEWSGNRVRQLKRQTREQKRLQKLVAADASDSEKEEHLMRKLKAGRITLEQFERMKRDLGIGMRRSRDGDDSSSDDDEEEEVNARGRVRRARPAAARPFAAGSDSDDAESDSTPAAKRVQVAPVAAAPAKRGGRPVVKVAAAHAAPAPAPAPAPVPRPAKPPAPIAAPRVPAVEPASASAAPAALASAAARPTGVLVAIPAAPVPAAYVKSAAAVAAGGKRRRKQKHSGSSVPFSKRK